MDISQRDENRVTTIQGVSSVDFLSPTSIAVDPITHGVIIDGASLYTDLDPRYVNVTGDTMTGVLTINTNSTTALLVEQDGVKDNVLVVDTTNGRVGINKDPTLGALDITGGVFSTSQNKIDGTSDQIQLIVQGHSTQTTNLTEWQNSSAGVLISLSGTGDLTFVGTGSGLQFGSFYGNELTATYAVNNSYMRIADTGCSQGELNGVTYTDAGTTLTITKPGMYKIDWAVSVESGVANSHVLGGIMIDSTTVLQNAGKNHFEQGAANRQLAMSGTAIINCPNGTEVIGVGVGSDSNVTLTVDHVNLTIMQVGA